MPRATIVPMGESLQRVRRTSWVWVCRCARCGHRWESTLDHPPVCCSSCRAQNWQRQARPYKPRATKT